MIFVDIIQLLIAHWFADFFMQTDEDAKNKSTSIKHLFSHCFDYFLYFTIASFIVLSSTFHSGWLVVLFGFIQGTTHFGIDYVTSKINSRLWKEGRTHDFFVSIGFDQLLHYIIMIITYALFLKI